MEPEAEYNAAPLSEQERPARGHARQASEEPAEKPEQVSGHAPAGPRPDPHGSDAVIGAYDALRVINLPLGLTAVEWDGTTLVVGGEGWHLTVMSPWRITRHGALLASYETPPADPAVMSLQGCGVLGVNVQASLSPIDPALVLDDGRVLEVFGTSTLEPWVLRTPTATVVADPQPLAGEARVEGFTRP